MSRRRSRSLTRWARRHPAVTFQLAILAAAIAASPPGVRPWTAAVLVGARVFWWVRAHDRLPRARQAPARTALYRWYEHDRLLYVGVSDSAVRRFGEHQRDGKAWTRRVTACQVVYYGTRGEALAAEKHAIRREHPKENIAHNGLAAA